MLFKITEHGWALKSSKTPRIICKIYCIPGLFLRRGAKTYHGVQDTKKPITTDSVFWLE